MTRPCKFRTVSELPPASVYKPRGVPMSGLETVKLGIDEFEAIRLADLEGLYQEAAAERMGISRQTFGNVIASARKKIADALANSKAIVIEGGPVAMVEREFVCTSCAHRWKVPFGIPRPEACPECKSTEIHRTDPTAGPQDGAHQGRCGARRGRCGR